MFLEGVKPKKVIKIEIKKGNEKLSSDIYDFVGDNKTYADSFGKEWNNYPRVQSDKNLKIPTSRRRLENLLGFPLEMLREKTVLEIGSGAGRFTPLLAKYAKNVVTTDLSEAIFINEAIGLKNVTFIRVDLNRIILKEKFDLVLCRGVLQHTPDPNVSIKSIFNNASIGAMVVFDIYSRPTLKNIIRDWKYFYRFLFKPIPKNILENIFVKYGRNIYKVHSYLNMLIRKYFFIKLIIKLMRPIYPELDVDSLYPLFNENQKIEVYCSLLLDALGCEFDNPRNFKEVVNTLSEIGQYPYSYNEKRCMFRVKKRNHKAFTPVIGKDGVFEKQTKSD